MYTVVRRWQALCYTSDKGGVRLLVAALIVDLRLLQLQLLLGAPASSGVVIVVQLVIQYA